MTVNLTRIYTRLGDDGKTHLGDMSRVEKTHARIEAYGTIDELNAQIGVARAHGGGARLEGWLERIQNDLFDLGADLCVPPKLDEAPGGRLRIRPEQAARLETAIDRLNAPLKPLNSFILPGGTPAASWCHFARTVCRRAERDVVALAHLETVNPQVIIYLNRLSDLLFVLGRVYNNQGRDDVLWQPGKGQIAECGMRNAE